MHHVLESSVGTGLVFILALVLVYVTVALMVMVRQFSLLSSLDTDNKRLVVVTEAGRTEVDTVRNILDETADLV